MFIVTAKAPKSRSFLLVAILTLAALLGALFLRGHSASGDEARQQAKTNEQRVAYLNDLGWEVDAEPIELLQLTLPNALEEPYRSYNELQLRQGFDLTPYLGKTLERCTYRVTNYPDRGDCQADLYIYGGEIVAGDVVCTGADGFIDTLKFPADK